MGCDYSHHDPIPLKKGDIVPVIWPPNEQQRTATLALVVAVSTVKRGETRLSYYNVLFNDGNKVSDMNRGTFGDPINAREDRGVTELLEHTLKYCRPEELFRLLTRFRKMVLSHNE